MSAFREFTDRLGDKWRMYSVPAGDTSALQIVPDEGLGGFELTREQAHQLALDLADFSATGTLDARDDSLRKSGCG